MGVYKQCVDAGKSLLKSSSWIIQVQNSLVKRNNAQVTSGLVCSVCRAMLQFIKKEAVIFFSNGHVL